MARLRNDIERVADLAVSVLLRGKTGVGKELVARAIHEHSRRKNGPYCCVNLSAIPPTLAASELFGHERLAFTGAQRPRLGYFEQAQNGTLFLDEIGDTPRDVQPLMLRALETGEIQKVGSPTTRTVDVRVIAATDVDLDAAMQHGDFRRSLLERVRGYEIVVPTLGERREDIPRLFFHFLRIELKETGESSRLEPAPPGRRCWVPASFITWLVSYAWPGNVRQLRNVARQIAIVNRREERFVLGPVLENLILGESDGAAPEPRVSCSRAAPAPRGSLSDERVIQVLRANNFNVTATAAALGRSRTWLFTWMDRCDQIRKASDLSAEEVRVCCQECGGDITAMASRLEVSSHGLKQRMKQLGLR